MDEGGEVVGLKGREWKVKKGNEKKKRAKEGWLEMEGGRSLKGKYSDEKEEI
jgi:hypothetical protein